MLRAGRVFFAQDLTVFAFHKLHADVITTAGESTEGDFLRVESVR